jgi:hypothetical protein
MEYPPFLVVREKTQERLGGYGWRGRRISHRSTSAAGNACTARAPAAGALIGERNLAGAVPEYQLVTNRPQKPRSVLSKKVGSVLASNHKGLA